MSEQHEHDQPEAVAAAPLASARRRRLIQLGASAVPAVLALKSTPVMACNCKKPSGFSVSGATSRQIKACVDPGKTPSAWAASCSSSSPYKYHSSCAITKNTYFADCGFTTNGTYTNKQIKDLLKSDGSQNKNVQALIVAVLLDSTVNGGSYPSIQNVKDMWNLGVLAGNYKPYVGAGSSATWNLDKVKNYLLYLTGQGF